MKKQIVGHIIFWAILIGADVSGYLPVWSKKIGLIATVNYSWILLMFYLSYKTGIKFYRSETEHTSIIQYRQFWIIASLPLIFIGGSVVTDTFILNSFNPLTLWSYCVSRLVQIYPFIGSAIFLAGLQTQAIQFKSVRRQRNELLVENNYLHEDKETLLKEINLLKFEAIASREKVVQIQREYTAKLKEYENIIRLMRDDDEGGL
jgi:hypothetical protein